MCFPECMFAFDFVLLLAVAYLLGSIPFGYLLVIRWKGIDVRSVGSGNIGFANVVRAAGWLLGFLVLFLDAVKGFIPVFLALGVFHFPRSLSCIIGGAAIMGHIFPLFLSFRGGKGVATALGVAIAVFKFWILIPLALFVFSLLLSRIVSLSVFLAIFSVLVMVFLIPDYSKDLSFILILLATALLILYRHKENVKRLLAGKELKLQAKSGE
ncbi:MAG: glycerol-3-phosphate 1-O-acyltransferase PlsY [bacterium JZ-2024 1]